MLWGVVVLQIVLANLGFASHDDVIGYVAGTAAIVLGLGMIARMIYLQRR